jgi:hypothetical protein
MACLFIKRSINLNTIACTPPIPAMAANFMYGLLCAAILFTET